MPRGGTKSGQGGADNIFLALWCSIKASKVRSNSSREEAELICVF